MRWLPDCGLWLLVAGLLAGCATVDDVQRASNLIRMDNELTRLLVEVRPEDRHAASLYLVGVATDAASEGDRLARSHPREAISFYRIAATALWRSGDDRVGHQLFQVVNRGIGLCGESGADAPDRDCVFLRLVIPFAAMEARGTALARHIENADPDDVEALGLVGAELAAAKPVVTAILEVGEDDRLLTHPGMRAYYCDGARDARRFFDGAAANYELRVERLDERGIDIPVTTAQAESLRELPPLADFCRTAG